VEGLLKPAECGLVNNLRKTYASVLSFPGKLSLLSLSITHMHWYMTSKQIRLGNGDFTNLDSATFIFLLLLYCIIHIYANVLAVLLHLSHLFCDLARMWGVLTLSIKI